MIAVKLMGGLGNQMFQYAFAKKVAKNNNTKLYLDLAFFDNIADVDTPREYELDCFKLLPEFLAPEKRPRESSYKGIRGKARHLKHLAKGMAWRQYTEPHHNFDPNALKCPDRTYFTGYWQTEKYFKDIRKELLADFTVKSPPKDTNKKILEKILTTESISIHVRRGDYVSNENANKFHGTKDHNYYSLALEKILSKSKSKKPTLFVFSDDPQWCKKNLIFNYPTTYVQGNEKGFEDMRLMTHCKHNIIANSSFSWWAAWLNTNPNKVIVAPKKWFNDTSVDTSDVVPKTWIKI